MQASISPFYDVYNLPFNSNCRILAAELNCTFIYIFSESGIFSDSYSTAVLNSDSSQNLRLRNPEFDSVLFLCEEQ